MSPDVNSPGILVVDDDEIVLVMVRRALETAGYRVFSASNAVDALQQVNSAGTSIRVAILDHAVSEGATPPLATALSEMFPHLRILIASGLPAGSIEPGPTRTVLEKPFNTRTLLKSVLAEVLESSHY